MKFGRAKILLVADTAGQMNLLTDALTSSGHLVTTATSTERALSSLKDQKIDLVIADIGLPDLSENEFYRSMKRHHPDLPVILITGPSPSINVKTSVTNGFISKPFRIGHIEELIGSLLAEKSEDDKAQPGDAVLIVDDDDTFRTMLIRSLQLSGYKTLGATDGKTALELLEKGGIGTVIADINMPQMDGITLMRKTRQQWPWISVILITGYYSTSESPAGKEDQPDGFLMKPFKIQRIDELLKSLISSKSDS